MRRFTIIGLALMALIGLDALSATAASAEDGISKAEPFTTEVENMVKPTFEISTKEKIQCESFSMFEVKFSNNHHGSGILHFTGCKAENLAPARTLGEEAGVISMQILFLICLIVSANLLYGLFIEPLATMHIEVPAVSQLLLFKGAMIAENKSGDGPIKEFLFVTKGKEGKQEIATKCVDDNGGEKQYSLEMSKDTVLDKVASATATFNTKFTNNETLMD